MEENFDNKLRDILNNPPEFEPSRSDLDLMLSKLRHNGKPNAWAWLLPLLLLPFFIGGYFLFEKVNTLSETITQLEAQKTNTISKTLSTDIDTTIHKTVYIYDTIYRKIYEEVYVKNELQTEEQNNFLGANNDKQSISISEWEDMVALIEHVAIENGWLKTDEQGNKTLRTEQLVSSLFLEKNDDLLRKNNKNQSQTDKVVEILGALEKNKTLFPSQIPRSKSAWKFPQNTIKKGPIPSLPRINPLLYTIPRGQSFGITGSPLAASPINGSSKFGAFDFGLSTALHFQKNVRLESGVILSNSKVYTNETELINAFPVVTPDEPSHNLKELKGTLSYLQIPIMFSKVFKSNARSLQPIIGLGIIAQKPAFQRLTYEFVDASGNEIYKKQTFRTGIFSIANPQISVGFIQPINTNYQVSCRGFYQRNDTQELGVVIPKNYFGLRLGLERKVF